MNYFALLNILVTLVQKVQADLKDGKLSLDEGVDLLDYVAQNAETYFPGLKPEADLVESVCAAVLEYEKAKAAQKPPTVTVVNV